MAVAGEIGRAVIWGDWRAAETFWLIVMIALVASSGVVVPIWRQRDRRRSTSEGVLFDGFAQMVGQPVNPPPQVAAAFANLRISAVFGRTAVDRDVFNGRMVVTGASVGWLPGRIARDRGAAAWEVPATEVASAEIGRSMRNWNVDINFSQQAAVHLLVHDGEALSTALSACTS